MSDPYMGDMSDPGTLRIAEDVVAFYIGGATPHVWTKLQIDTQTAKWRHPIWVYDPNRPGADNGIIDAHKAVQQCRALGVPSEVTISFDMETHVDPAYLNAVHSVVAPSGYWTGVYGSRDYITQNPSFGGGRWVADWTDQAHYSGIEGEWACQFQPANDKLPWDLSLVKSTAHLWDVTMPARESAVLVRLPSGSSKIVYSVNGGVTWE